MIIFEDFLPHLPHERKSDFSTVCYVIFYYIFVRFETLLRFAILCSRNTSNLPASLNLVSLQKKLKLLNHSFRMLILYFFVKFVF